MNDRDSNGQRLLFKTPKFVTLYYYLDSTGKYIAPSDLLNKDECGVLRNDEAFNEVKDLFGFPLFEYTKPASLVKYLIRMIPDDSFTVLDFFSGSGTTAQAVFELNREDGGERSSILVQIPDKCPIGSNAAENGFKTICEIGEERIRLVGKNIKAQIDKENEQLELGAEPKPYPDLGFRVLRIDSSNFKDFYLTPGETAQESLFDFADNVKEGRSDLDLLFEVLPKLGIPYSAKIEERMLAGRKVFFVDGDKLAACFDANVGSDTIEEMANGDDTLYTVNYDVFKDGEFVGSVSPAVQLVQSTQQQKLVAGVISFPTEDLFVVYKGVNTNGDFSMDVRVNPLFTPVWVGFGLLMLGVLIATAGRRGAKRGKQAEEVSDDLPREDSAAKVDEKKREEA